MIRDWRSDDAKSIARYANNRKIWLNLRDAFPSPYALADAEAFITRATQSVPGTFFAIATETEAIGSIALTLGQDVHRFTAELGYWLGEPFWGRGITAQAVRAICRYAFEELGLNRIFAEPYITNPASARVLEKAGFICEGVLRANAVKDGRVLDQLLYARVKDVIYPS